MNKKDLSKNQKELLEKVINKVKNNINGLAGSYINIDLLQLALKESGYTKGNLGEGTVWYKTNSSNINGYVAELEAIKENDKIIINIENIEGEDLIKSVNIDKIEKK